MDQISVFFVLPQSSEDESDVSDLMSQAYETCRQNSQNIASCSWIRESCFDAGILTKTDFMVFQDFSGKLFEEVQETKSVRIVGPMCLLACFTDGTPIPNYPWPIYNIAMAHCVVTCSHISKDMKLKTKEKVQLMGGCYVEQLLSTVTHLITESVKSEKYLVAAERGLKLMTSLWVDSVWAENLTKNIHCEDQMFNKHKCLPFHKLTISSTGIPNIEMRSDLSQNIVKHGGVFTGNLSMGATDVLLVYDESALQSKKYKAAKSKKNIYCVSIDWIKDSIEKGYAVRFDTYIFRQKDCSTPNKDAAPLDFSVFSCIGDTTKQISTVEGTLLGKKLEPTIYINKSKSPSKRKSSDDISRLVQKIDIKKAKRAGQYLDGCSVYLAGFKPDQREKLTKVLNLSGATRYDDISDRLTHIIIGDSASPEVKIIKSRNYDVSLVSIHWLIDSMENERAEDEEKYLINLHDSEREQFSSPLGRKGLSLLRSKKIFTSNELEPSPSKFPDEEGNELMRQYLHTSSKVDESDTLVQLLKDGNFKSNCNTIRPPENTESTNFSTQNSEYTHSEDVHIFSNKKFVIVNFDTEECQAIKDQVEAVLGTVMPKTYKGIPDYVITPAFIKQPIQNAALETVSNFWITECIQQCEEVPIVYYHRPYVITDDSPLSSCVVTISGYCGYERGFLKELILSLGGFCQEQFARIDSVAKNVKASTHLVCLEAEGKKYVAALKWGLPVVNKDWLLECAKSGRYELEDNFLIGASKAPLRSTSLSTNDTPSRNSTLKASTSNTVKKHTPRAASSLQNISMRMGLTPVSQPSPLNISRTATPKSTEKTPLQQKKLNVAETPYSQVTPVNKYMEEVRKTNLLGTPITPDTNVPKTWYDVDTPESPFGAFLKEHPSAKTKKELMRYINQFPDFVPPPTRRKSTPFSEVKRRCWARLLGTEESPSRFDTNQAESTSNKNHNEENRQETENVTPQCNNDSGVQDQDQVFLDSKMKKIEELVNTFGGSRRSSVVRNFEVPVSQGDYIVREKTQPFTVGWDYDEEANTAPRSKIFMLSGLAHDQRQNIIEQIESLGGQASELGSYDPNCTHLVCIKPARNEKTMACMAAGKWILHTSYIEKSVEAGEFLPEENFEFGNPNFKIKIPFSKDDEDRLQAVHHWRKEIGRRNYGAFNDMRAIVVSQKREPIVRIIEAGGGQVLDISPPFTKNVVATHCLIDCKTYPDHSLYVPLAQQGIFCVNIQYISDYLFGKNLDIKAAILSQYSGFYT